jgi:hypothetical protein
LVTGTPHSPIRQASVKRPIASRASSTNKQMPSGSQRFRDFTRELHRAGTDAVDLP